MEQKRGEGKQRFYKGGGKLGQWVSALKMGNGLIVVALDFQSVGRRLKSTCWLQGRLSLSNESIKWVLGIPGDLEVEGKLSPFSGSAALRQLNLIHKKGPKVFF